MFPAMPAASADGGQGVTRLKSSTFEMTPPAEVQRIQDLAQSP